MIKLSKYESEQKTLQINETIHMDYQKKLNVNKVENCCGYMMSQIAYLY